MKKLILSTIGIALIGLSGKVYAQGYAEQTASAPGYVGIGYDGHVTLPTPQNKLLVESGVLSTTPYSTVTSLGVNPAAIGIYAYANTSTGINSGFWAVSDQTTEFNMGIASYQTGATHANWGYFTQINGDNVDGDNTGVFVQVHGDNVPQAFSGEHTGNYGFHAYVDGDGSNNVGILANAQAPANSTATNIGVIGNVSISNWDMLGMPGNCRIGVYGAVGDDANGDINYGVWGDLSQISPPSSTTVPYYSVYGTQAGGTTSGTGGYNTGTNSYGTVYAGYFEGDVYAGTYWEPSDPKLKKDIEDYKGALSQIQKLPIKQYAFNNDMYPKMGLPLGQHYGILTTDMKEVFPSFVKAALHPANGSNDKSVSFEAVNYNALIPVLIQAMKELNGKVDALGDKPGSNTELQKKYDELETMLNELCTNGCGNFKPYDTNSSMGAALYQSVPNPASESTTIGYTIDQPFSNAGIYVITNDGKPVAQFKIAEQGKGSVNVQANTLPGGVYQYYLMVDGKLIDSKSLIITR